MGPRLAGAMRDSLPQRPEITCAALLAVAACLGANCAARREFGFLSPRRRDFVKLAIYCQLRIQ
jgi:hypothetical protein